MEHKRLNAIFAIGVLVISWIVYFISKAPTLSFWDCGEFVACSYSLGVPHPPGTPLFVILGKFVSMLLFFIQEKAVRITLMSVTGGAVTTFFVYLLAIRFLILGFGMPETFWKKFSLYAGGIIAALCSAFASTVWFNNVESEVYGVNIAAMLFTNWLILKWAEKRGEPGSDRYLILIVYVAFLNIGIHVQALLVMPSFFLYAILIDKEKLRDWRFWAIGVVLFMQAISVSTFLWLAPAVLVISFFVMLFSDRLGKPRWQFVFWMCFAGLLGYSIHMYIPIRSAQDPIIDENDPENWTNFKYFLERKQYGNESMVEQMFIRKSGWRGQLWDGKNMGYGLYHLKQFNSTIKAYPEPEGTDSPYWRSFDFAKPADIGKLFLYLIPTFIMFFGMYEMYKRHKESSWLFITLFLVNSLGLILYMNFKDGSNPEFSREVRERDYFFTTGFLYYMMWVGIGATAVMRYLLDHGKEWVRKFAGPAVCVVSLCLPVVPLAANYDDHSRQGDYVPWDYSYNLLMSCEKDGILFTNGDNDTFPVWALQEVYGVRKDVRIVNLSLLNTDWYIEQLKTLEPKVPISFTLEEIKNLQHQRNPFEKDVMYPVGQTGLVAHLSGAEKQKILRIQDIMVINIVESTNWKKPIYFAVTVSNDGRMGLDQYLSMEGLVFKLKKDPPASGMDIEKTLSNLNDVYRFRGLGDGSVYMDEDTRRLLTNYTASFLGVALEERRTIEALKEKVDAAKKETENLAAKKSAQTQAKQLEVNALNEEYERKLNRVTDILKKGSSLVPDDWRPRVLLAELLFQNGRLQEAEEIAKQGIQIEPERMEYWMELAMAQDKTGKKKEAIQSYNEIIKRNPDFYNGFTSIADIYKGMGQKDSAVKIMEEWIRRHPGDRRAQTTIESLKKDS